MSQVNLRVSFNPQVQVAHWLYQYIDAQGATQEINLEQIDEIRKQCDRQLSDLYGAGWKSDYLETFNRLNNLKRSIDNCTALPLRRLEPQPLLDPNLDCWVNERNFYYRFKFDSKSVECNYLLQGIDEIFLRIKEYLTNRNRERAKELIEKFDTLFHPDSLVQNPQLKQAMMKTLKNRATLLNGVVA